MSPSIQHERARGAGFGSEPAWAWLLSGAFVLIPYVVSFALVSIRRYETIAAGAGVAAVFFGITVLVSPYLLLVMFLLVGVSAGDHGPDGVLIAAGVLLLAYLGISLRIVWSAFRVGKVRWNAFLIAACATGLYVYAGYHQVASATIMGQLRAQRQQQQSDTDLYKPVILARQLMLALTACLLRNHMQHPEAGYPTSLESPPLGWTCDTQFEKSAIEDFTFDYTPQSAANSAIVTDFRLVAVPLAKGVRTREPMMTDSRGILFSYYPWEIENARAQVMVVDTDFEHSQIDQLQRNIEQYANANNAGTAPAQLNSQIARLGYEIPTIDEGGMRLMTRDFETLYVAPSPAHKGFSLSVQCKSYGQNCLRSFFLDPPGVIHGTGEPRRATAQDPALPLCERVLVACPDVDWSVP